MSQSMWVMIAAAGRPQLLRRTLESIGTCRKPASFVRTIVIENGPRCGIEPIVRELSGHQPVQYLYSEAPNKSRALNLGLAHTDGGLIVFTDDDVRVHNVWLTAYAAANEGANDGRFFGGPVHVDAEHGLPPVWMRHYYPATLVEPWELPHDDKPATIPDQTFMGPNWAAFGHEIVACGGFDEKLGPRPDQSVGEETEIQRQLAARGSRPIYVPEAIAWHYLHEDYLRPEWLLKRTYRHGLAWGILRTRGGQRWKWPVAMAAARRLNALVKGVVLRTVGGEKGRFKAEYLAARWRGRWDGLWQGRHWSEPSDAAAPQIVRSRAA